MENKAIDEVEIMKKQKKEKVPIECHNCGYSWKYGGYKKFTPMYTQRTPCPRCMNPTKIPPPEGYNV